MPNASSAIGPQNLASTDAFPARLARKKPLRLRFFALLMIGDAGALLGGFLIGNLLRFGMLMNHQGVDMFTVVAPLFLIVAFNNGAYSVAVLSSRGCGETRALQALSTAAIAVIFIAFYLKTSTDFSRLAFSYGMGASAVLLICVRRVAYRFATKIFAGSPISTVLLVDGGAATTEPGTVVIEARTAGLEPDVRDPIMLDRLGRFLKDADRVVVSCSPERRANWTLALKGANVQGEIVDPSLAGLGVIGTGTYGGEGTFVVAAGPLGLRSRLLKRVLDLALTALALVLLAPLMIAVAVAIKLEDGGPVFFVQERVGRGNCLFAMIKFRSMKFDSLDNAGHLSTQRRDGRVTRVGRIIRGLSIDELPQLFNVLRGEMSLVGPRPHALGSLAGDQLFWDVDQRYWIRHASKPGLTGLAQVRGLRGATLRRSDLVDRLQADLEYLNGWSLSRDIKILAATLKVLVHRNAF